MGVKIEAVKIMVDNQSTFMLIKTSTHHNRTKQDARYHFIWNYIEDRRLVIKHVKTEDQLADILIKTLRRVKFGELSERIEVKKAWDEKKIKEENVWSDFLTSCMAGARGTAVAHRWEHPACAHGARLAIPIALTEVVPTSAQRHTGACATTRQ